MKSAIVKFFREEEGTELVEWGLIAGLLVVVAAGFFTTIGSDISSIFGKLATETSAADAAAVPSGGGGAE